MSNTQTVKYIISLVTLSQDAQVSTLVFKILAEISAAQTPAYTTALSEVEATSSYISKSLKKENSNELLTNVTCLVANLAFAPDTQVLTAYTSIC
ncbi:hypothetical protein EB796_013758 [Bugula neritina]|uniref:Uncharacterized protein n=1 Tax=Bugula neritina TaxID=10212 RepID=A0A7J7JNM7_BUGNE|nr:hypothetical protein EB796_013758 [Bugula neritina]